MTDPRFVSGGLPSLGKRSPKWPDRTYPTDYDDPSEYDSLEPKIVPPQIAAFERARQAYRDGADRGCLAWKLDDEAEPRITTVSELAARFALRPNSLALLAAIRKAVARYDPENEVVLLMEWDGNVEVTIFSPDRTTDSLGFF